MTEPDPPRTSRDPGRHQAPDPGPVPVTRRDQGPPAGAGPVGEPGPGPSAAPYRRITLPPPLDHELRHVRELNPGGEADVVLCEQIATGRLVVVKVYRQRNVQINDALLALLMAGNLDHLVQILRSDEYDGYYWEEMEYLELGSLADLAKREGLPLPISLLDDILAEMVPALEYTQSMKMVHRDIKPENILVRTREPLDLVLADFGLAVTLTTNRAMLSTSRTSAYAAPEATSGEATAARDWWSLGMTLLELATGEHPFRLNGQWLSEQQIMRELLEPIDVSQVPDPRWQRLLRGLLTISPTDRWGAEQVRRWLAGENPSVVEVTESYTTKPTFALEDVAHTDAHDYAEHMARAWGPARQMLLRRDGEEFQAWLEELDTAPARAGLQVLAQKIRNPDRRIAVLVATMAPDLAPVFDSYPVGPDQLAASLARPAQANTDNARDVVNRLLASGALVVYARLEGCERLAVIDQAWQAAYSHADEVATAAASSISSSSEKVDQLDQLVEAVSVYAPAGLLEVVSDPAAAARLSERATAAATAKRLKHDWYARFSPKTSDDPTLVLAKQWLQVNSVAYADEQDEREAKRKEAAERATREAANRGRAEERRTAQQLVTRQRRANVRLANRNFRSRLILVAILLGIGTFWAGSYTFSLATGQPKGIPGALRWCGTWVVAAVIVIWVCEALFGRPGSGTPSSARASRITRRVLAIFALAGVGVWAASIRGHDPSIFGWAAIPIFIAIGYATVCILGGPSRPPLILGAIVVIAGGLLLAGITLNVAAVRSGNQHAFDVMYNNSVARPVRTFMKWTFEKVDPGQFAR